MDDRLEEEYRTPYAAWKAAPGPTTNAAMLTAMAPAIDGAIRTHVGASNPLLVSRARMMALQGLRSYDPRRGRLQTHVYNQLLGLKRANRQQTQILRVPERLALSRRHLDTATQELQAKLGREPTDVELSDATGFDLKHLARIRAAQSGLAEGYFDEAGGEVPGGVRRVGPAPASRWHAVVYDELDDYHKKIMEYAYGLHGRRPLQNQEIAVKLRRSPGAISQAKARIQAMLDEEHELSPFGG